MRIAILAERMLPGSIPKIVSAEASYLSGLGHEVEVVTIMEGGLPPDSYQFQEFLKGVRIRELSRELPLGKYLSFKLPFFSFLSAYHLLGPLFAPFIIKKGEYDIIIALNPVTCLTAYMTWRRRKIPYVDYHWDPFSYIIAKVYRRRLPGVILPPLLKLASWFDKLVVDNSLVAITVSEDHAGQLRSLTQKKDVAIVYLGCKPVEHIPEARGDYLLAIDRWDRGNMPHLLLDVMAKLNGGSRLFVAGFCSEEWIRESFLEARDEKGLAGRVKWLGPVSEEVLNNLYLGARAWIHPIEETSVSMPALEAAAHGCPVIMPRGSPLFQHGVHGLFPEEGNIDQYAEFAGMMINDEHLAREMGGNAWKLAREYDWTAHAHLLTETIMKYIAVPHLAGDDSEGSSR
ncbi:MAG: hypothetical protein A2144_03855 [Chloroflexi bacterium RBG_16_50_9]|nr:MAG: hypothetical protein A2144_03855 [Chloroflexi bacterium RBG_16_50_9]